MPNAKAQINTQKYGLLRIAADTLVRRSFPSAVETTDTALEARIISFGKVLIQKTLCRDGLAQQMSWTFTGVEICHQFVGKFYNELFLHSLRTVRHF